MCISCKDNKVIKSPGYEVLLYNVDQIKFDISGDYIYIYIDRNKQTYRFLVSYAQQKETDYEE